MWNSILRVQMHIRVLGSRPSCNMLLVINAAKAALNLHAHDRREYTFVAST